jgi:hypothetical protein
MFLKYSPWVKQHGNLCIIIPNQMFEKLKLIYVQSITCDKLGI